MKQSILFLHKQRWICALLLLPLGEAGRGFAQQYTPFPTDSAQWSVWRTDNSQTVTSFQYKMKGDTVLNGITYHKIYYSLDLAYNSPNQILHCFVRGDTTKKVFVKYPHGTGVDTSEFMLYNFNLAVGDTVTIKLLYPSDSLFKLLVTSIDSNQFLTGYRKSIGLKTAGITMWGGGCDVAFSWTDGMGSNMGGLFYNELPAGACFNGYGYYLQCFWHKGVYVFGGNYCDYATGVGEIKTNDNNWQVYPNPNDGNMMLDYYLNTTDKGELMIYDIAGKLIYKYILDASASQITISHTGFSNGIYFYRITVNDNTVQSNKLIIIK